MLAAVGAGLTLAVFLALRLASLRLAVIWERPGAGLVSAFGGRYLLKAGDAFEVWDSSGKVLDAGPLPGNPVMARDRVLSVDLNRVISVDLAGRKEEIAGSRQGETVVAFLPVGLLVTASPACGLEFGEPWNLRAIDQEGVPLWEQKLAGPPFVVSLGPGKILAGVTDLSSGGTPSVVCLDARSGEIAWTAGLERGMWRALGLSGDGGAVAVLDSGVTAVSAEGSTAWRFTPGGPVIAAAVAEDAVFLVSGPGRRESLGALLSPYTVEAVSSGGTLLWAARIREPLLSVLLWRQGPPGGQAAACVVALGETHVIGFSMRDGERLFSERTGFRPVNLQGDCLLVQRSQGLCLVSFRPGGFSGRARSP